MAPRLRGVGMIPLSYMMPRIAHAAAEHPYDLSCRFHVSENAVHRLEFCLVSLLVHLGGGVADKDRSIVKFNPAAHGIGDADTGRDTGDDTGGDPFSPEDCIERCVGEAAETLFGYEMLALVRFELLDDLGPPRPLNAMRLVAANRDIQSPKGEL